MKNGVFLVCIGSILVGNAYAMELKIESDDLIKRAFAYQSVSGQLFKTMEIIPDNVEAMQKTLNAMESFDTKLMFVVKMIFEQKEISLQSKVDLIKSFSAMDTVGLYEHEKKRFTDLLHFLNKYIVHKKSSIQKEQKEFCVNTLVKRFSPIKRTFVGAAVSGNKPDVLALLCAIGANLNIPDDEGKLSISYAIKNPKRVYMIPLLMRFGDGIYTNNTTYEKYATWLIYTVKKNKISAAEKLLGVCTQKEINQPNKKGKTVLHYAAARGYDKLIERLCMRGADPALGDNFDATPIFAAIKYKHERSVKSILDICTNSKEKKACVSKKNIFGITPLMLATALHLNEIVVQLCEEGANPSEKLDTSPMKLSRTIESLSLESEFKMYGKLYDSSENSEERKKKKRHNLFRKTRSKTQDYFAGVIVESEKKPKYKIKKSKSFTNLNKKS